MANNYNNRRSRGQCASCTGQAIASEVRCEECKAKHKKQWTANSKSINERRRERRFQESLDRERRLELLDIQLQIEIKKLDSACLPQVATRTGGTVCSLVF